jgi:hypothetical protein
VPVEWEPSADRHGIPHGDAVFAVQHAVGAAEIQGRPGEETRVFVGHPHGQTEEFIEVIIAIQPPGTIRFFHVMGLSDKFRYLAQED